MTKLKDDIKECIVKDYFTPNIQAEVILDALLTPYIAEIVEEQAGNLRDGRGWSFTGKLSLITKEMSVMELEDNDSQKKNPEDKSSKTNSADENRGTKIDYVLGDENTVYLVELKTTDSSIEEDQAERYLKNCRGKTFGEVFGNQLLSIMRKAFGDTYKKKFPLESSGNTKKPQWDEKALKEAFLLVFDDEVLKKFHNIDASDIHKPSGEYAEAGEYPEAARELIRKARWTQSRKYLYTAGQVLDYLVKYPERTLWDKPLKLIYLTPHGKCPSKKFRAGKAENFCIGSYSLIEAYKYLENKQEDELARLLSDIIKYVYDVEGREGLIQVS